MFGASSIFALPERNAGERLPAMTFVQAVPEGDASGEVAELYETHRAAMGHLPNYSRAFSHRPAVFAAWTQLNTAIKAGMDLRRYELATVAAARRLYGELDPELLGTLIVGRPVADQ
jgi:hypothetical protein